MAHQLIDPNKLSDVELKAHVYDMIAQVQMTNQSIDSINQILAQRAQGRLQASQAVAKTAEESESVVLPTE